MRAKNVDGSTDYRQVKSGRDSVEHLSGKLHRTIRSADHLRSGFYSSEINFH
jgi:hypothetical protein